ncbi:uncharacterized protein MONOS_1187 [Monocercomonoides exilis]|uniref:uncharacterized protein n=1 Tax=Monocercomonoides exilis TaxID=2049356 RepID=UPI00355A7958|nr:hypothetical protein MONOS_1187 [Monocercomonoides exilis]|eukprot:MONOS_1187.1-p1 / transcript=MONOS_1187.1 / gene=MONOS_1187 / organism=Monocercomonoides_exilis_PA203 / gene_product=unspecified product / transcript_product=unspecified product / location=Mono_scaffold00020:94411-100059(+) / protein_length=1859 / sequence_SO=supercontig / SO=protein_coding / is_pseudo=false
MSAFDFIEEGEQKESISFSPQPGIKQGISRVQTTVSQRQKANELPSANVRRRNAPKFRPGTQRDVEQPSPKQKVSSVRSVSRIPQTTGNVGLSQNNTESVKQISAVIAMHPATPEHSLQLQDENVEKLKIKEENITELQNQDRSNILSHEAPSIASTSPHLTPTPSIKQNDISLVSPPSFTVIDSSATKLDDNYAESQMLQTPPVINVLAEVHIDKSSKRSAEELSDKEKSNFNLQLSVYENKQIQENFKDQRFESRKVNLQKPIDETFNYEKRKGKEKKVNEIVKGVETLLREAQDSFKATAVRKLQLKISRKSLLMENQGYNFQSNGDAASNEENVKNQNRKSNDEILQEIRQRKKEIEQEENKALEEEDYELGEKLTAEMAELTKTERAIEQEERKREKERCALDVEEMQMRRSEELVQDSIQTKMETMGMRMLRQAERRKEESRDALEGGREWEEMQEEGEEGEDELEEDDDEVISNEKEERTEKTKITRNRKTTRDIQLMMETLKKDEDKRSRNLARAEVEIELLNEKIEQSCVYVKKKEAKLYSKKSVLQGKVDEKQRELERIKQSLALLLEEMRQLDKQIGEAASEVRLEEQKFEEEKKAKERRKDEEKAMQNELRVKQQLRKLQLHSRKLREIEGKAKTSLEVGSVLVVECEAIFLSSSCSALKEEGEEEEKQLRLISERERAEEEINQAAEEIRMESERKEKERDNIQEKLDELDSEEKQIKSKLSNLLASSSSSSSPSATSPSPSPPPTASSSLSLHSTFLLQNIETRLSQMEVEKKAAATARDFKAAKRISEAIKAMRKEVDESAARLSEIEGMRRGIEEMEKSGWEEVGKGNERVKEIEGLIEKERRNRLLLSAQLLGIKRRWKRRKEKNIKKHIRMLNFLKGQMDKIENIMKRMVRNRKNINKIGKTLKMSLKERNPKPLTSQQLDSYLTFDTNTVAATSSSRVWGPKYRFGRSKGEDEAEDEGDDEDEYEYNLTNEKIFETLIENCENEVNESREERDELSSRIKRLHQQWKSKGADGVEEEGINEQEERKMEAESFKDETEEEEEEDDDDDDDSGLKGMKLNKPNKSKIERGSGNGGKWAEERANIAKRMAEVKKKLVDLEKSLMDAIAEEEKTLKEEEKKDEERKKESIFLLDEYRRKIRSELLNEEKELGEYKPKEEDEDDDEKIEDEGFAMIGAENEQKKEKDSFEELFGSSSLLSTQTPSESSSAVHSAGSPSSSSDDLLQLFHSPSSTTTSQPSSPASFSSSPILNSSPSASSLSSSSSSPSPSPPLPSVYSPWPSPSSSPFSPSASPSLPSASPSTQPIPLEDFLSSLSPSSASSASAKDSEKQDSLVADAKEKSEDNAEIQTSKEGKEKEDKEEEEKKAEDSTQHASIEDELLQFDSNENDTSNTFDALKEKENETEKEDSAEKEHKKETKEEESGFDFILDGSNEENNDEAKEKKEEDIEDAFGLEEGKEDKEGKEEEGFDFIEDEAKEETAQQQQQQSQDGDDILKAFEEMEDKETKETKEEESKEDGFDFILEDNDTTDNTNKEDGNVEEKEKKSEEKEEGKEEGKEEDAFGLLNADENDAFGLFSSDEKEKEKEDKDEKSDETDKPSEVGKEEEELGFDFIEDDKEEQKEDEKKASGESNTENTADDDPFGLMDENNAGGFQTVGDGNDQHIPSGVNEADQNNTQQQKAEEEEDAFGLMSFEDKAEKEEEEDAFGLFKGEGEEKKEAGDDDNMDGFGFIEDEQKESKGQDANATLAGDEDDDPFGLNSTEEEGKEGQKSDELNGAQDLSALHEELTKKREQIEELENKMQVLMDEEKYEECEAVGAELLDLNSKVLAIESKLKEAEGSSSFM